jgi:hypothetical protein
MNKMDVIETQIYSGGLNGTARQQELGRAIGQAQVFWRVAQFCFGQKQLVMLQRINRR